MIKNPFEGECFVKVSIKNYEFFDYRLSRIS